MQAVNMKELQCRALYLGKRSHMFPVCLTMLYVIIRFSDSDSEVYVTQYGWEVEREFLKFMPFSRFFLPDRDGRKIIIQSALCLHNFLLFPFQPSGYQLGNKCLLIDNETMK